jgi:DNA-binding XRE family transcriptional regulator
MARARRHLAAVPAEFDATELSTKDLAVHNVACELAAAPAATNPNGPITGVQQAVKDGQHRSAIDLLGQHLAANQLTTERRRKLNNGRFAELRRLRGVTQAQLANAIGIGASALSQFEAGKVGLELIRLLLAADALGVAPEQFLRELK